MPMPANDAEPWNPSSTMNRLAALCLTALLSAGPATAAAPKKPAAGAARKFALLIGIGDYTNDVPDLEGPPHDVAAMKKALVEHWGFPPANVQTLVDAQASKAGILSAFDTLVRTTQPRDYIFIYYSGHGTSAIERSDLGLDGNTGALVPADLKMSDEDLTGQLIVGSRDLRPRLEKLDRDREVLAVFDSCYSGAAVRSLRAAGKPRFIELPKAKAGATRSLGAFPKDDDEAFGSLTEKAMPYPYQNVVYISAASKAEAARDITASEIKHGEQQTVDGEPHGALTNFFLAGLSGQADSNGDRAVSYGELYSFVRTKVSEGFPQQPQLLVPETHKDVLLAKGILGDGVPAAAAPTAPENPAGLLKVKLEGVAPVLAQKIKAAAGVTIVSERPYDVLVVQDAKGYTLYHGSGDVLASYGTVEPAEVAARVARQVAVRELVDFAFPAQDFNASVRIPGNRGFLRKDESFTIDMDAEKDSVFLLLDVDTTGYVSVLFPFGAGETVPRGKAVVPPSPDTLKVGAPYGTEYLKLFAFREKPAGIERWMKAGFPASDPQLEQLLKMLREARGGKAQDRLKVVTRESGS
jgi:hypothetical protein